MAGVWRFWVVVMIMWVWLVLHRNVFSSSWILLMMVLFLTFGFLGFIGCLRFIEIRVSLFSPYTYNNNNVSNLRLFFFFWADDEWSFGCSFWLLCFWADLRLLIGSFMFSNWWFWMVGGSSLFFFGWLVLIPYSLFVCVFFPLSLVWWIGFF